MKLGGIQKSPIDENLTVKLGRHYIQNKEGGMTYQGPFCRSMQQGELPGSKEVFRAT